MHPLHTRPKPNSNRRGAAPTPARPPLPVVSACVLFRSLRSLGGRAGVSLRLLLRPMGLRNPEPESGRLGVPALRSARTPRRLLARPSRRQVFFSRFSVVPPSFNARRVRRSPHGARSCARASRSYLPRLRRGGRSALRAAQGRGLAPGRRASALWGAKCHALSPNRPFGFLAVARGSLSAARIPAPVLPSPTLPWCGHPCPSRPRIRSRSPSFRPVARRRARSALRNKGVNMLNSLWRSGKALSLRCRVTGVILKAHPCARFCLSPRGGPRFLGRRPFVRAARHHHPRHRRPARPCAPCLRAPCMRAAHHPHHHHQRPARPSSSALPRSLVIAKALFKSPTGAACPLCGPPKNARSRVPLISGHAPCERARVVPLRSVTPLAREQGARPEPLRSGSARTRIPAGGPVVGIHASSTLRSGGVPRARAWRPKVSAPRPPPGFRMATASEDLLAPVCFSRILAKKSAASMPRRTRSQKIQIPELSLPPP